MFLNASRFIHSILVCRIKHSKSHAISSLIDFLFRYIPTNPDAKYVILEDFDFLSLFTVSRCKIYPYSGHCYSGISLSKGSVSQ